MDACEEVGNDHAKRERLLDSVASIAEDAVFLGEIFDRDGDVVRWRCLLI